MKSALRLSLIAMSLLIATFGLRGAVLASVPSAMQSGPFFNGLAAPPPPAACPPSWQTHRSTPFPSHRPRRRAWEIG